MNRQENSELVTAFGDHFQLMYGVDVGHFAKKIDDEKLRDFCSKINHAARHTGCSLSIPENALNNSYRVILRNFNKRYVVCVALLDHTIFIDANDEQWKEINDGIFFYLQTEWRKFMAKHIAEYRGHLNTTLILNQCDESLI